MTAHRFSAVTRVVRDYDEAISWFTEILGFVLLENARGTALLLACAATTPLSSRAR